MAILGTRKQPDHVIDRFAGLSDRAVFSKKTRIECHEMLDMDFDRRAMEPRNGFLRAHTGMLRDCSVRLNGRDQWVLIPHISAYQWGNRAAISIDCVLREFPGSEVTVLSKGFGTGSDRFFQLSYDPTINTNNGGWRLRVWDAGAGPAALVDITVDDGTGTEAAPVDEYRHIQFAWRGTGDSYRFGVFDATGSTIGSTVDADVATWATNSDPWTVGVSTTDGETLGADYAHVTVAELRMWDSSSAAGAVGTVARELDSGPDSTELTDLVGYWKFNDGQGATITDSSTNSNDAIVGADAVAWVSDPTLILGTSGLRFLGQSSFVHWVHGGTSYVFNDFSAGGPTSERRWTVSLIFTPELDAAAAVPDGVLLWSGTGATDPAPVGITISSDQFVGHYRDGTSTKTVTTNITGNGISDHAGKRIRVVLELAVLSGTETLRIFAEVEQGPGSSTLYVGATAGAATDGANPLSLSTAWSIGARLTTTTPPLAGTAFAYGVMDDVRIIRITAAGAGIGAGPTFWGPPFQEVTAISASVAELTHLINMNEGAGTTLAVGGSRGTDGGGAGYLYPEPGSAGLRWDVGIVDPYEAVEITYLGDFTRILADGTQSKSLLAISGVTLYEINTDDATTTPRAANLVKGGRWTAAQRGAELFLASKNGNRPVVWRGQNFVDGLGILKPQKIPVVTGSNSGGSLFAGEYHVYVTYRTAETGVESNPSPAGTVTIGTSAGQIIEVVLPISDDPQVNQRRIWVTAAGGGAGSTAFLAATIDNNVDANLTDNNTAITTLPSTPTLEYTANEVPPPGGIIQHFRDRLYLAGIPNEPNKVYFTKAGTPWAWGGTPNFVFVTRDKGDPVTALDADYNDLEVHLRDGRKSLFTTGTPADPVAIANLPYSRSAVNPQCVIHVDSDKYFFAEEDIVLAGSTQSDISVSSPPNENFPSVEQTVREYVNPARRDSFACAWHKKKKQVWAAYSSDGATANDRVLVYHYVQRIWSLYGMEMDLITSVENRTDDATLYGASRGYVVQLDTGTTDGGVATQADLFGTATGGTTATLIDSGESWTVDTHKGLDLYWVDLANVALRSAKIRKNSANTLSFYSAAAQAPAASDPYWIAPPGLPFADFTVDAGSALSQKKLRNLLFAGHSTPYNGDVPRLRAQILLNNMEDTPTWSSALNRERDWTPGDIHSRMSGGGKAYIYRIRVSGTDLVPTSGDSGDSAVTVPDVVPNMKGKIRLEEIAFELIRLGAR